MITVLTGKGFDPKTLVPTPLHKIPVGGIYYYAHHWHMRVYTGTVNLETGQTNSFGNGELPEILAPKTNALKANETVVKVPPIGTKIELVVS